MSFSFTATATTEISTLSLHDAFRSLDLQYAGPGAEPADHGDRAGEPVEEERGVFCAGAGVGGRELRADAVAAVRSEEHTSELQSLRQLVCRLLLEKKQ